MSHLLSPHLLVDISAHGYGHVAQTLPVVNELAKRISGLRVTVRSAAPLALLQQRIRCDFRHISVALDFGMKMANAVDVQIAESAAAYRDYHADWDAKVQHAADEMRALQPDLLLANVPYMSLAAAKVAGVRAAAMCCLNWADLYRHYCADDAASAAIHAHMLDAYNSAEVFLKVQPTMPMPDLRNARSINPIAQLGRNQRTQIDAHLPSLLPSCRGGERSEGAIGMGVELWHAPGSTPSPALPLQGGGDVAVAPPEKLILVAMGGIAYRLPMEHWPRIEDVRWLIPQDWNIKRDDMIAFDSLGLTFSDVLASCDAVLTKPGYGTFAEAACAGVPVLYVSRRDWPEEPYLVQWLQQHGVCCEVERERLQSGDIEGMLRDLWAQPQLPVPIASGAAEAAEILAGMM